MESAVIVGKRPITTTDYLAPGHRACLGCGEELAVKIVAKALGKDIIITNATGCTEIVSSPFPYTSWRVPWFHALFENTAAVASGVEGGIKALSRKGKYSGKVKSVAMAGDGATADIGMQALSGALERKHDMIFFCFDNEAYMNTGIQRSGATPYGASTTTSPAGSASFGQTTWKKNMPAIAAAHDIPYVATASPSYPFDLINKINKAKDIHGPSYIHVLSVCPTGWRSATDSAIELGRLAVQTGIFPLYEIENGDYKLNMDFIKLRPIEEYLKLQGRYRHLAPEHVKIIQDRIEVEYAKLKDKANRKMFGSSYSLLDQS
jgi:pyruvate ferredoxin oxidoreductase beta subunit